MSTPYYNPQGQPGYPPQGQPVYPPQGQPGYPPTPNPQYQQPGYPPQPQYNAPPAPQQAPVRGTLAGFFGQPVSGGKGIKFVSPGQVVSAMIARDVTNADVQQETDFITKQLKFYRDNITPKLQLIIPLRVQPDAEYPEGEAAWYVKTASDRTELVRALNAAGVEPDKDGNVFPRGGDLITITYTHDKPGAAGMHPTKVKAVQYTVAGQGSQAPALQQVAQQAFSQVVPQPPVQPQYVQQQQAPQVQYQTPAPQDPQFQAPVQQAPVAPQIPGLTPEQAALVAQQIGQQQAPQG